MSMWSLRGHVDRKPPRRATEVCHAAAGLERSRMTSRKESMHASLYRRLLKNPLGPLTVARFPVEDVIVLLLAVFAKQRCVGIKSFVRVHKHRQFFIFHFH